MPLGTKVGLGPGRSVLHGDPAPPSTKRGTVPPIFRPISIVAKRSPISATAEHLFETCERTDRHTDTLIAMPRTPSGGEVKYYSSVFTVKPRLSDATGCQTD